MCDREHGAGDQLAGFHDGAAPDFSFTSGDTAFSTLLLAATHHRRDDTSAKSLSLLSGSRGA